MTELCTRFVMPKSCDWTTLFSLKNIAPAEMNAVKSARLIVSNLPGPWIAQRAVSFTATPMTFTEDLKVVLSSFVGFHDDQSTEVRILVSNAVFDSMSADGRRMFNDLQRAANVSVGSYETYPLVDETAVHVVGRLTAIVKFAKLLNETLRDKPAVLPVCRRPIVARYTPSGQVSTAPTVSFGVPVRHVGRVKSSRFSNYFTRPAQPTIIVEPTSQPITEPAVTRPLSARRLNQAMREAALDVSTAPTVSFGVPARHVGRVKSSRFSNYFTRPAQPTIIVEPTLQLITEPAVTRPLSARRLNQAMRKAALDVHTLKKLA